jgi:hypothetical protein
MVEGLDLFRRYFKDFADSYAIIGGTAASEWFDKEEIAFRATKDIDMVLLIEAIDEQFLKHFWNFIKLGEYELKQRSDGKQIYYRFAKPAVTGFPVMLELFSKNPKDLVLGDEQTIIPITTGTTSSLSAILMDDDYYKVIQDFREVVNGLPLITIPGIIILKAKAWLDLSERKQAGDKIDSRHIRKHRNDVFRLAMLLTGQAFSIPQSVYDDFQQFLSSFPEQSPEWRNIQNAVGRNTRLTAGEILEALKQSFVPD